jgi:hypothetical protein
MKLNINDLKKLKNDNTLATFAVYAILTGSFLKHLTEEIDFSKSMAVIDTAKLATAIDLEVITELNKVILQSIMDNLNVTSFDEMTEKLVKHSDEMRKITDEIDDE